MLVRFCSRDEACAHQFCCRSGTCAHQFCGRSGTLTGVYLPKPWGLGEFVLYIIGPDILRDASQRLSSTRWSAQYSNHTVSDNHLIGLLHGTFDGYSVPITID